VGELLGLSEGAAVGDAVGTCSSEESLVIYCPSKLSMECEEDWSRLRTVVCAIDDNTTDSRYKYVEKPAAMIRNSTKV